MNFIIRIVLLIVRTVQEIISISFTLRKDIMIPKIMDVMNVILYIENVIQHLIKNIRTIVLKNDPQFGIVIMNIMI